MRMYFNSKVFKLPGMSNYDAITLLPLGIFFRQSLVQVDAHIINHEMIHVEQIKKLGVIRFYTLYVYYYAKNIWKYRNHDLAYRNIPFEIEAYEKQ